MPGTVGTAVSVQTVLSPSGATLHVVQRLLGHSSTASTVGYTHLVLDDLRGAVADVWGAD